MVRLEKGLDECLERLKERCQKLHPELDVYADDDLDSIASSSRGSVSMATASGRVVRFGSQEGAVARLRKKLASTEQESASLKQQVKELQALLGLLPKAVKNQENSEEEKKLEDKEQEQRRAMSEGGVWHLVRHLKFTEK
jgi:predicted RNase H-like nuclease (RuvC/YqgF family)